MYVRDKRLNEVDFTPEEVEENLHLDLINYLLDYNKKAKDHYNEILITSDGYCTIVQWFNRSYNDDFGKGSFKFVDEDEVVMKELIFPDNSTEYVLPEECDERLNEWLKEHPGYEKDEWGNWIKPEEVKDITTLFDKDDYLE